MTSQTDATWPDFAFVPLDKLYVDVDYQRPLTNFVHKIAENFDPALVGTLVVSSHADGRYAVVDGQTRMEGTRLAAAKGKHPYDRLPCVVFKGLQQADEADLFWRIQKERKGVHGYYGFRAKLVAGRGDAVAIRDLVQDCGYEIGVSGENVISAVAALEHIYGRGATMLERTLLVFKEAWKDQYVPAGAHLRGMAYFLSETKQVDDEKLARRISLTSPEELKRRASAAREGAGLGGGSDKYMAIAINGVYQAKKS